MARQPDVKYINAYVSGTTAYKMEPLQPGKRQVRLPRQKKRRALVIRLDPVAIFGAVAALVMAVFLLVGGVQLGFVRHEAQVLEGYVSALQQENQQLQDTYSESYDLDEIRRIAIAMGMVPMSQVQVVEVPVIIPQIPPQPTPWESFRTFVAELFA